MNRPYSHRIKFAQKVERYDVPVQYPRVSGKDLETVLKSIGETGRLYAALGTGGLGALLGAGIGGLTASQGKRLRNALIGAGIGGLGGATGGYYGSKHIYPINFSYRDIDNIRTALKEPNIKNIRAAWADALTDPEIVVKPISLAEIMGGFGNINLLHAASNLNKRSPAS
jgi:hypothetical protein